MRITNKRMPRAIRSFVAYSWMAGVLVIALVFPLPQPPLPVRGRGGGGDRCYLPGCRGGRRDMGVLRWNGCLKVADFPFAFGGFPDGWLFLDIQSSLYTCRHDASTSTGLHGVERGESKSRERLPVAHGRCCVGEEEITASATRRPWAGP